MKKAFTLIELMIVIAIIAILAAITLPSMLEARKAGNETSAISSLRTIHFAQSIYLSRSATQTYGDLDNLGTANLLDTTLGSGSKQGYLFDSKASEFDTPEHLFFTTANPALPGETGSRFFYSNDSGIIYFSTTGPLTKTAIRDATPTGQTDIRVVGGA